MVENATTYYADFLLTDGEWLPKMVYRRDQASDGLPKDYYVGKGGIWVADSTYDLGSRLAGHGDSPLKRVGPKQADEFIDMVKSRSPRPLSPVVDES